MEVESPPSGGHFDLPLMETVQSLRAAPRASHSDDAEHLDTELANQLPRKVPVDRLDQADQVGTVVDPVAVAEIVAVYRGRVLLATDRAAQRVKELGADQVLEALHAELERCGSVGQAVAGPPEPEGERMAVGPLTVGRTGGMAARRRLGPGYQVGFPMAARAGGRGRRRRRGWPRPVRRVER
ncbi:hypothetical protein ACFVUN_23110 [Kitasatospora griseola]|uniref:hypothetical protein n=1 Tax=Kitasatospora griseola TaxID=2064 RepID=UPI0036D8FA95